MERKGNWKAEKIDFLSEEEEEIDCTTNETILESKLKRSKQWLLLPVVAVFVWLAALATWHGLSLNDYSIFGIYERVKARSFRTKITIIDVSQPKLLIPPWHLRETVKKHGSLNDEIKFNGPLNGGESIPSCVSQCTFGLLKGYEIEVNGDCNASWPYVVVLDAQGGAFGSLSDVSLPCFLQKKLSRLKNAGHGIFSKIGLPAGVVFGPYMGIHAKYDPVSRKNDYSWLVPKSNSSSAQFFYVDASDSSTSNWMRYVNSARYMEEQNVFPFHFDEQIYYLVTREISANSELLTWYGNQFTDRLGLALSSEAPNIPGVAPSRKFVTCLDCVDQAVSVVVNSRG